MYRQHYPDDPGMHNTPESYTRTSRRRSPEPSLCDKVKQSLVAIVVGVIIISAATGLLFWNEGRAVQTAQSLEEGLKQVRILKSTDVIFDENNGKLIHVAGPLKTSKVLFDETYSIAVQAVKLRRHVEMYQWVESESRRETHDGETVSQEVSYSYSEQWRSDLIRSSSFNNRLHVNPETFAVEPKMYVAEDAQIGSFFLSKILVEKITSFHKFQPSDSSLAPGVKVHKDYFYHGSDPQQPQIGDVRVSFEYAGLSGKDSSKLGAPDEVSVIARQSGHQLASYETESGDELQLLYPGEHTPQYMIGREHMSNKLVLWALRFVGWLLMFIGFSCLTSFCTVIVDRIPILREVLALGAVSFCVVLSISLSLTTIAIGWIWYRPYIGFLILAVALSPFVLSRWRARTPRTVYRQL